MDIKKLGLEEMTLEEKKKTKGGFPWLVVGLVAVGLTCCAQPCYGGGSSTTTRYR